MTLYVTDAEWGDGTKEATVDDVLAYLHSRVESGTIKGRMRVVRSERNDNLAPNAIYGVLPGTYIVIGPVSDGGSET